MFHISIASTGITSSVTVVITNADPFVISIDIVPSVTVFVSIHFTYPGISPSFVVTVRCIIGVSHRAVVSSVWTRIDITETNGGSCKVSMEWSVHIVSVVYVDEPCVVAEHTSVVVDMQASDPTKPSVVIPDIHVSYLGYATIVVIKDWNIFHLDYSTIIVILNKGIIVVS